MERYVAQLPPDDPLQVWATTSGVHALRIKSGMADKSTENSDWIGAWNEWICLRKLVLNSRRLSREKRVKLLTEIRKYHESTLGFAHWEIIDLNLHIVYIQSGAAEGSSRIYIVRDGKRYVFYDITHAQTAAIIKLLGAK